MSVTQQQVADAVESKQKSEEETQRDKDFASIKRESFTLPEQAEAAEKAASNIQAICNKYGLPFGSNMPEDGPPKGFEIVILPLKDKVEGKGHVLKAGYVGCIPSVPAIQEHEKGNSFLVGSIREKLMNKLANAASALKKGEKPASVPVSVGDFVVPMRTADEGLAAYRELAQDMVEILGDKGLKKLDKIKLRQCLQSQAFAENAYRTTPAKAWTMVLDVLIQRATEQGLATTAFDNWKATREEASFETGELDVSDLADLA